MSSTGLETAISSDHEHLKVWPHHSVHAKRLRDPVKLIQVQASAPSCLDQCFEDDIHADFVPESEAVGYRASDAVDPDTLAFDAMLLDAKFEQRRRDSRDPKRWIREAWNAGAARHREPDIARQLGPDVVKAQGGEQTNRSGWSGARSQNQRVILAHVSGDEAVPSRADPFEFAGSGHAREGLGMYPQSGRVARPKDRALSSQF